MSRDYSQRAKDGLAFDVTEFKRLVAELALGKRLPDAVYLHRDSLENTAPELRAIVDRARFDWAVGDQWNVVKLARSEGKVSFLWYPDFFSEAFPALTSSTLVDLVGGRLTVRAYKNDNPPILHRKESLLPAGHPRAPEARALTRAAEDFGLFDEPRDIGHRRAWEAKLARLGLRVEGHRLVGGIVKEAVAEVQRHRTALTRYALSTPMQALWRHGFLDGQYSVFDYGCGRGDDLRALQSRGLDAAGWDPYFARDGERREADVVNLGFVLNVIEDLAERREALARAWAFARRVLVVGVLIGGRSAYERFRLYQDGVLTARGTFQKYYTTTELREYLEAELGREPVALAPGIAFVFRDDSDEQAFLARRASSRPPSLGLPSVPREERPPKEPRVRAVRARAPSKWELNAELVEAFWQRAMGLGRLPEGDEFDRHGELRDSVGAAATVLRTLLRQRGAAEMEAVQRARRDDVLVFLALNLFERRRSFSSLPETVRRDVKAFLGSYQAGQLEAQRLLFSAGSVAVVQAACAIAAERGLGYLDGDHSLQLHSSAARDLPAVLRIYLGCAARLYGDVETADIVKIHIQSGKLSLLTYDSFEGNLVPDLIERVKINLRRQQIDFFEYGTPENAPQPLYLKSRYLRPDAPEYAEQAAFDAQLASLGLDLSGFGPSKDEFAAALKRIGYAFDGERIARVRDS